MEIDGNIFKFRKKGLSKYELRRVTLEDPKSTVSREFQVSVVSKKTLNQIFNGYKQRENICHYNILTDCDVRGQRGAVILESLGILVGKVFIQGNGLIDPNWNFHIAMFIAVEDETDSKKHSLYVIDPTINKEGPLSLDDWLKASTISTAMIDIQLSARFRFNHRQSNLNAYQFKVIFDESVALEHHNKFFNTKKNKYESLKDQFLNAFSTKNYKAAKEAYDRGFNLKNYFFSELKPSAARTLKDYILPLVKAGTKFSLSDLEYIYGKLLEAIFFIGTYNALFISFSNCSYSRAVLRI